MFNNTENYSVPWAIGSRHSTENCCWWTSLTSPDSPIHLYLPWPLASLLARRLMTDRQFLCVCLRSRTRRYYVLRLYANVRDSASFECRLHDRSSTADAEKSRDNFFHAILFCANSFSSTYVLPLHPSTLLIQHIHDNLVFLHAYQNVTDC